MPGTVPGTIIEQLWLGYAWPGLWIIGQIALFLAVVLIGVAYLTLAERKVLGAMQFRKGPTNVGPFGLLQPFADAIKMLMKETIIPSGANKVLFLLAPLITFVVAIMAWAVIPVSPGWVIADINVGMLYLFAVSSLGVYGVIMAGWASNSRYAFLGALRSAAQMVSYEVSIGFVIVTVLLCVGSLNLTEIVMAQQTVWFAIPLLPMFVVYIVSCLAETNRTPFDLPQAEAELVHGHHVEYSSMTFLLFFMGEYTMIVVLCSLGTILFLGGWLPPFPVEPFTSVPPVVWFALKVSLLAFVFLWARGTLPRYRYDQLMRLGWKVFLPLSLAFVLLTAGVLVGMGWAP